MINFYYETHFRLTNQALVSKWIKSVILKENKTLNEINYIFCNDNYLYKLNQTYLNHNTLTDILTFNYSERKHMKADIFVSTERVADNANKLNQEFYHELHRVLVHGVLHLCGYNDATKEQKTKMRHTEDYYLTLIV